MRLTLPLIRSRVVRGALQWMFERKMAVEQPVKEKITVQVRIKVNNA